MTDQKDDVTFVILFMISLLLLTLLIGRAVWRDADEMLERAKDEYVACLTSETPVSHCEQEWTKAQNAYWVP